MYAFIKGKFVEGTAEYAVIEVGGVGYKLFTPMSALGKFPAPGKEITLHASFVVRENSHALYGFLEKEEKGLFESLIEVSGIGPKTALSLIGHLSLSQFYQAVQSNNLLTLSKVPGIGKKTAERLVVEMRGKKVTSLLQKHGSESYADTPPIQDALATLLNLGFTHASAEAAVKKALNELPPETELSKLVATALRVSSS